ncbi:unnamed protein product, partial [marine sediment metagenome]
MPSTVPATQPKRADFVDEYHATFQGPIVARQYRGDQEVGSLDADRLLEVIFDFGPRQRQAAGVQDRPKPATTRQAPSEQQVDSKMIMTWTGPLKVIPTVRRKPDKSKNKMIVTASGENVVMKDERNTITCNEFSYDMVQRSGRIRAAGPALARVADNAGRYLSGHDIRFDRSAGLLEVIGPGEAAEAADASLVLEDAAGLEAPGQTTLARWSKHMVVRFRRGERALEQSPAEDTEVSSPEALIAIGSLF